MYFSNTKIQTVSDYLVIQFLPLIKLHKLKNKNNMKKIILLLSAVALSTLANAQGVQVTEGANKFSTGIQNALSTTILENNKSDVESEWKSVLKDFKYEKIKEDKGEWFADNVVIKEWGNNTVDIYTLFEEDKKAKTVKMHVAFDLGGAYLKSSEQKEKFVFAEKLVRDFAIKIVKLPLEEKLKEQGKLLVKFEDNQKDLEKDNKNLKSDIESYKEKIKKAEGDIKKNEDDQVKKKVEIETQKKAVEAAKKKLESVK